MEWYLVKQRDNFPLPCLFFYHHYYWFKSLLVIKLNCAFSSKWTYLGIHCITPKVGQEFQFRMMCTYNSS